MPRARNNRGVTTALYAFLPPSFSISVLLFIYHFLSTVHLASLCVSLCLILSNVSHGAGARGWSLLRERERYTHTVMTWAAEKKLEDSEWGIEW